MLGVTIVRPSTILSWILELFQPNGVCLSNVVAISWRSALIWDVIIIISFYFSSQVWYLISLTVIQINVFLLTAAAKSDDNYTAVYIGVGASIATALVVVIVVVTLR